MKIIEGLREVADVSRSEEQSQEHKNFVSVCFFILLPCLSLIKIQFSTFTLFTVFFNV